MHSEKEIGYRFPGIYDLPIVKQHQRRGIIHFHLDFPCGLSFLAAKAKGKHKGHLPKSSWGEEAQGEGGGGLEANGLVLRWRSGSQSLADSQQDLGLDSESDVIPLKYADS